MCLPHAWQERIYRSSLLIIVYVCVNTYGFLIFFRMFFCKDHNKHKRCKMKLRDDSELSDLAKAVKNPDSHILVNFCQPQGRYNGGDKGTQVRDRSLAMANTAWSLSPQRMAAVVPQLQCPSGPMAHSVLYLLTIFSEGSSKQALLFSLDTVTSALGQAKHKAAISALRSA